MGYYGTFGPDELIDISYAYTTPCVRALQKDVTRRDWKDNWGERFFEGQICAAMDKRRDFGGKEFGKVRLTCKPYKEHCSKMPDRDYAGEGFEFLDNNPGYKPPRWQWTTMREHFEEWRQEDETVWVCRFEIVELYNPLLIDELAIKRFAELM